MRVDDLGRRSVPLGANDGPPVASKAKGNLAEINAFDPSPAVSDPSTPPPLPLDTVRSQQIDRLDLPDEWKANLHKALAGGYGNEVKDRIGTSLDAILYLSPSDQAQALTAIARGPDWYDSKQTSDILSSPAWEKMSPEQKSQMCQLIGIGDKTSGIEYLDKLSQTDRLFDKDKDGRTLISNLFQLSSQPMNPALGTGSGNVFPSTLREVADPSVVEQTSYNTCTVTSMQYAMAKANPSEYARIINGLAGQDGQVVARGGGKLFLQKNYYTVPKTKGDVRDKDLRTASGIIFQNAAMAYGAGASNSHYDASKDESHNPGWILGIGSGDHQGLWGNEEKRAASNLFGTQYDDWEEWLPWDPQRQYDFLSAYRGKNPVVVNFDISKPQNHAMTFDRVEGGRVYLRNPWGRGAAVPSGFRDEDHGEVISISEDEFKQRVRGVIKPSDPSPFTLPFLATR